MSGKLPICPGHPGRILEGARDPGARHVEPDAHHRFLEKLAVFSLRDGLRVGPDQSDIVPNERAIAIQFHGGVERRLATHRRQDRVRLFPFQDQLDHFRRDRLDVGAIGKLRIGHDRGRIGIHEHDLVALFAQGLAGLHAGIIKFATLPDNDRAGTNKKNFVQLVVPRHAQRETMQKPAEVETSPFGQSAYEEE